MSQESPGATRSDPPLTAERVIAYLRENPDFLNQHPEVLRFLNPPARPLGDGIADLQLAMIERLKRELAGFDTRQRELVDTSRANLATQARVHECVLALLAATSFEQVIQTVTTDFAVLLDLDVVTLCIEADGTALPQAATHGLHVVAPDTVARLVGHDDGLLLRSDISGDPEIFGGAAPLVRSDALARLDISPATPPALIAFGSREPDKFPPGQATELLGFLAAALGHIVRGWLNLPQ